MRHTIGRSADMIIKEAAQTAARDQAPITWFRGAYLAKARFCASLTRDMVALPPPLQARGSEPGQL
jgi:hypothetical protein